MATILCTILILSQAGPVISYVSLVVITMILIKKVVSDDYKRTR